MKNLLLLLLSAAFLGVGNYATAQNSDAPSRLINDMLLVASNFAAPGAEGAALQSSAGWFSSGRTMEKWQVDVSIHGNALFVPQGKQKQLSNNRDFSILNFRGTENALLPTVYGGQTDAVFEGQIFNQNFSFDAIDGLDKEVIVHPFPQVTVGLPYSTEVAVRFLPSIVIDGVGFSTYGMGLKHNITQYFERRYNPEDFQFAVIATYSNFKVDYAFDQLSIPMFMELNRIDVNANLWLAQVMGSKLYGSFEIFGGLGTTFSQFEYKMGGTGDALPLLNNALTGVEGGGTRFKGDVGFNYHMDRFKISTMLTASNFFNANISLHYNIR